MSRKFLLDLTERAVSTFVQAFAAVIVAQQRLDSLALKAAAAAGVLSVAKGLAARGVGDRESAGVLVEKQ